MRIAVVLRYIWRHKDIQEELRLSENTSSQFISCTFLKVTPYILVLLKLFACLPNPFSSDFTLTNSWEVTGRHLRGWVAFGSTPLPPAPAVLRSSCRIWCDYFCTQWIYSIKHHSPWTEVLHNMRSEREETVESFPWGIKAIYIAEL